MNPFQMAEQIQNIYFVIATIKVIDTDVMVVYHSLLAAQPLTRGLGEGQGGGQGGHQSPYF